MEELSITSKSQGRDRSGASARSVREYAEARLLEENETLKRNELRDIWHAFRRRKLALALCTVAGALAGSLAIVPQADVYTAKTTLEVQGINENFIGRGSVDPQAAGDSSASEFNVQTQLRLLSSDSLVARVREKLAPETLPFAPPTSGWLARLRTRLKVVPPDPIQFARNSLDMAVLTVNSKALPNTRVIEIRCDSTSPEIASTFLNTLTSEFADQTFEARTKSAQKTNQWLLDKLQETKAKLDDSENKLQDFVRSSGLVFLNEENTLADAKLKQLQSELAAIQADRIAKQSRYETATGSPADSLPDVLDDGSLNSYKTKLTELRVQLAELSTMLTPAHYKVKNVQVQIAEMESALEKQRANILRRIRNEYEGALRREKLLSAAYAAQSGAVAAQSDKGLQYATLKREVEANMQLYNSMLQQTNQAGIASSIPSTNIRVVDPASPPVSPSRPIPALLIGLGLMTGIIGGCVLAVVRDQTDPSVGVAGPTPGLMGVPHLGVIPASKPERRLLAGWRGRTARLPSLTQGAPDERRVELVSWSDRESLVAEAVRVSVASLMLGKGDLSGPSVIVVTSPGPREGKTTVLCNVAIALAEIGRRVLVIDADLRSPRLHEIFAVPNSWGLTDLLHEQTPIEQYPPDAFRRATSVAGISILPSGPPTLKIAGLYYSPRLRQLLTRLREEFDTVLLDTAPMLHFSEARILARMSDGVVMVLRSGKTDREAAIAAAQRLDEDGTYMIGTILNDWSPNSTEGKYYKNHRQHPQPTWQGV